MAELYSEGRQPNKETAEEILKRLEALNNYIPSSEATRREYRHLLLKEYREYVESQTCDSPKPPSGPG
jgi:hypothetical protein